MNLKIHIKRVDGRIERLAGDEADPRNIPQGFTKSSAIPGGWTTASFTLSRSAMRRDLDPFDELVVMGDGNSVIFEGYGIEYPGSDSEDDTVTVTATGWSSVLKDNPCPTIIGVDRDLNAWGEWSLTRRAYWPTASFKPLGTSSVLPDPSTGVPGLHLTIPPNTALGVIEAMYDAGPGARIASIYYDAISKSAADDSGQFYAVSDGAFGSQINSSDLLTGTDSASSGTYTLSSPRRYGFATLVGASSASVEKSMTLRKLAVYGDHPFPRVPVSGEPDGVLASDVLTYLLQSECPELNVRVGPGGIEPTSFVIPHLVLRDVDSIEDAVLRINRFDISDWGVYDNRTPFLRPPGTGRTFIARTDDHGVTYNDAGLTGDDVYTGVIVSYNDPSGKQLTAGPPGSGCDSETPVLVSDENAATKRGRRRIGKISLSATAVERDAIQTGSRWIQEKNQIETRGDAEVSGTIRDLAGFPVPVSEIKAGDQIIFPDREWKARRIVEETWSAETDTTSLSLDAMPSKIDAMMERMGVFNEAENI